MGYEFGSSKLINGVAWAVVVDNKHPTGAYMVKCKLPWISSADDGDSADFLTTWIKVCSPMAGSGRGFYCLPEIGDEVVLAFVHGNIRQPVMVGAVWNDTDTTPHGDAAPADAEDPMGNKAGMADAMTDTTDDKNNNRSFISRSGSVMMFDDTEGKEKIIFKTAMGTAAMLNDEKQTLSFWDSTGEVYLVLDAANKKITMETLTGDIDIFCKDGTFNVEAKFITMKSSDDTEHEAGKTWFQKSGQTMDLEAGATMTLKGGPKIDLNP